MIALSAFAAAPGAAWAADPVPAAGDAAGGEVAQINDIVVTACRPAENLQTVPVAVTALSGEALQRSSIRDMYDLQHSVPSLQVSTQFRKDWPLFQLRGQRTSDQRSTQDGPVAVYFNDIVVTPWFKTAKVSAGATATNLVEGDSLTEFSNSSDG